MAGTRVTCSHRGHSAGVHWLLTGGGPGDCIDPVPAPAPKRPYAERGHPRERRTIRLDQDQDGAVAALADAMFGGNYSAALGYLVELGVSGSDLYFADGELNMAAVQRRLAGLEASNAGEGR